MISGVGLPIREGPSKAMRFIGLGKHIRRVFVTVDQLMLQLIRSLIAKPPCFLICDCTGEVIWTHAFLTAMGLAFETERS